MKKIILLVFLPFSLFASNLGKRGVESAGFEGRGPKIEKLTECPFGVTKIIFEDEDNKEAPGAPGVLSEISDSDLSYVEAGGRNSKDFNFLRAELYEGITDKDSIKRLCEISEKINNLCELANKHKSNEVKIKKFNFSEDILFEPFLFETLLKIDSDPNNAAYVLDNLDDKHINALVLICYYFRVKSEAVKAIVNHIIHSKILYQFYLKFIKSIPNLYLNDLKDLPAEDLFQFFLDNLDKSLSKTKFVFNNYFIEGEFSNVKLSEKHIFALIGGDIIIIDVNNPNKVENIYGDFSNLIASPKGDYLIAEDDDEIIYVIDVNNLGDIKDIKDSDEFLIFKLASVDAKSLLITTDPRNNIVIFSLDNLAKTEIVGKFSDLRLSPDGRYLVAIDEARKNEIAIIDLSNINNVKYISNKFKVFDLTNAGNKSLLITTDSKNNIAVFSLDDLEKVEITGKFLGLSLTSDKRYLSAINQDNNKLALMELNDLKNIIYIEPIFSKIEITPDAKYFVGIKKKENSSSLVLISLHKILNINNLNNVLDFVITPDFKYLFIINNNKLHMLSFEDEKIIDLAEGNFSRLEILADGKYLMASDAYDNQALIDLRSFKELDSSDMDSFIQVSPDGKYIVKHIFYLGLEIIKNYNM